MILDVFRDRAIDELVLSRIRLNRPQRRGRKDDLAGSQDAVAFFAFNKLISIEGYAKFYLLEISPEVKLYLQPISFHPKTRVVASGRGRYG